MAGYSLTECAFCGCAAGQQVRAYWQRKAAERQQRQLERLFATAGIPLHFQGLTMDTLLAKAGDDPDKQDALRSVQEFMTNGWATDLISGKRKPGLLISGAFGCGKTGVLTPALREYVAAGRSGLWIEVYDFISAIQQEYNGGDSNAKLLAAQQADIVLLDDLGDVERNAPETPDRRRIVYQLINARHNAALPMLVSTNCDGAQLAHQFGARTVERLMESCAWVEMGGRNLRME